jgi:hypothetical protein
MKLIERLCAKGISTYTKAMVNGIGRKKVYFATQEGKELKMKADTLIPASS